jgi:hypothetical protein
MAHLLKTTPFRGTQLYSMMDGATKKQVEEHPEWLRYDNFRFNLNPASIASILRRHPRRAHLLRLFGNAIRRVLVFD